MTTTPPLTPITTFVARAIKRSTKNQTEIARAMGFRHPNMVTMIKTGVAKMPFGKIDAFCQSTGTNANELTALCLRQYVPDIWELVSDRWNHRTPDAPEPVRRLLELGGIVLLRDGDAGLQAFDIPPATAADG